MKQKINKQTNKTQTKHKPEKGAQLDGTTGEATLIAPETDPAEESVE